MLRLARKVLEKVKGRGDRTSTMEDLDVNRKKNTPALQLQCRHSCLWVHPVQHQSILPWQTEAPNNEQARRALKSHWQATHSDLCGSNESDGAHALQIARCYTLVDLTHRTRHVGFCTYEFGYIGVVVLGGMIAVYTRGDADSSLVFK